MILYPKFSPHNPRFQTNNGVRIIKNSHQIECHPLLEGVIREFMSGKPEYHIIFYYPAQGLYRSDKIYYAG